MHRLLTPFAVAFALALPCGSAVALGFGKTVGTTHLGQPLNFVVKLRLDADDGRLESRCVRAQVTVGERTLPADAVRARLERVVATGERQIRVTTAQAIDEPVVAVELRLECPARLGRSFVVFADPPSIALPQMTAQAGDPAVPENAEPEGEASVMSGLGGLAGGGPTPSTPRGGRSVAAALPPGDAVARPTASAPVQVARAPAEPRASAATRRPRPADTPRTRGAVLRLDPMEAEVEAVPLLRMSTQLSAPDPERTLVPAEAAVEAPAAAPQPGEFEKLLELEASVRQLQRDNRARQQALDELRARGDDRWTPVLAWLSAALACMVVGLMWLRRRDRRLAESWAEEVRTLSPEVASPGPDAVPPPPVASAPPAAVWTRESLDILLEEAPTRAVAASSPLDFERLPRVPPRPPSRSAAEEPALALGEVSLSLPRRPMSAEELIDLEQQVEFFVVLGQDDAAIDLLMGQVRSTGGISPLPYLKLLEIYRRRGDIQPYERMRERFNRRFNGNAPPMGANPVEGRHLPAYEEVMGRLESAWTSPSSALALLDVLLFKRDPEHAFDLPAYGELVFLYGIARDLCDRDGEGPGGPSPATRVDLDLSLAVGPVPTQEALALRPERP